MGAVLYSLASGAEPFARANSMVDLMHRKRIFFESEENERLRRLNVAEGMGGTDSASASRKGSLRGRKTGPRSSVAPGQRRDGSADSIESVASNITNMSGRAPTAYAIASLLSDDQDFVGSQVVADAAGSVPSSPLARAASIHISGQQQQARNNLNPPHLGLPGPVRRTASFQGAQDAQEDTIRQVPTGEVFPSRNSVEDSGPPTRQYGPPSGRQRSSGSVSSVNSLSGVASQLYAAVSQALERAKKQSEQESHRDYIDAAELTKAEQVELNRHYADGMPPMILPGGGRLPDAARDLLIRMLKTDPEQRPTASEVKQALLEIRF